MAVFFAGADVLRARTLLEVAGVFSDQPSGRAANEILARMPAAVVAQQRRYQRERRGWTGLTTRRMADEIAVEGHGPLYSVLSWQARGRIVGYEIVERRHDEERFELLFAERSTARDRQSLANFGRRLLHVVYAVMARDWLGRVPALATPNPEDTSGA